MHWFGQNRSLETSCSLPALAQRNVNALLIAPAAQARVGVVSIRQAAGAGVSALKRIPRSGSIKTAGHVWPRPAASVKVSHYKHFSGVGEHHTRRIVCALVDVGFSEVKHTSAKGISESADGSEADSTFSLECLAGLGGKTRRNSCS
jgi:hypothetical protein